MQKSLSLCSVYFYNHLQDKRSLATTTQDLQTVQPFLPHRCTLYFSSLETVLHQGWNSGKSRLNTLPLTSAEARSLPRCSSFALTSSCTPGPLVPLCSLLHHTLHSFILPDWQITISGRHRKQQRMHANILARWIFHTSGSVSWLVQAFRGILCSHSLQQSGSQNPSHKIAGKSILLSFSFDCVSWYRPLCSCTLCTGYIHVKISI